MKFLIGLLIFCQASAFAEVGVVAVRRSTLLSAVIVTGAGSGVQPYPIDKTFMACGTTSAGAGAATVKIQVSNAASPGTNDWLDLGTITLVLATTQACDGFASAARWKWFRANLTAVSGTDGTVTATMGY